ncbi:MAG: 30S ribosomal protein S6--L-glutamate ligase, partial [Bacteroidota bacterium]
QKRGHRMRILDYMDCDLVLEGGRPQIFFRGQSLKGIDAIIPRIGASATYYGAAVIKQFEMMGVFSLTSSDALLQSRNKLRSLQILSRTGVDFPRTVFANPYQDAKEIVKRAGGVPLVIKLLRGTHGLGVVLAENNHTAESVIEAFAKLRERVIVQEFIKESNGEDIRAFVVGNEIVASMKRKARPGEFRSNLHRGGASIRIKLTDTEADTAKKATAALGLQVAGVDLLQSNRGPLLLEVNASPGLEGIETTTNIDIAGKIIALVEQHATSNKILT